MLMPTSSKRSGAALVASPELRVHSFRVLIWQIWIEMDRDGAFLR